MAFDRRSLLSLALIAGVSSFTTIAVADDFSCQDRIVAPGRLALEVRELCGPPDAVVQRSEMRTVRRPARVPCYTPYGISRCTVFVEDTVEVNVEDWTYDFGTRRLMRFLTFEQGTLLAIQTGGYGHKPM
jgi:hypothetical protein